MSRRHLHASPGCLLLALGLMACGADTGGGLSDAAVDAAADVGVLPGDTAKLDAATTDTPLASDGPPADAQPTVSVEPTVAFAEIAGNYAAKAANVSGAGATLFDDGQPYTFSINANGTFSASTKGAAQVFTWAMHAKKITRNTKNNVTVIEFDDPGKRLLNITYVPSTGPFDIAGVIIDPTGRWYLSSITKM